MSTLQKALSSNSTDTSFPTRNPTATTPAGLGATSLYASTGFTLVQANFSVGLKHLLVIPYGVGADNTTFDLRLVGWRQTTGGLWVPIVLCQVSCTLSALVGVSGQDVTNTERFCDTITLGTNLGNSNVSVEVLSPQNDRAGHILLDTKGSEKIEFLFDMTGATSGNALVGVL